MPTAIEWTEETWNPVTGCTRVSPGCLSGAHCYIERTPPFRTQGRRFERVGNEETTGVRLHPERLDQPLRWRRPRRIFVCSLADLFHEDVADGYIMDVWRVMGLAQQHTFQVLTKRPERAREWLAKWADADEACPPQLARGPYETRARHTTGRAELFSAMLDRWGAPPAGTAFPPYDWMEGVRWWPAVLPNVWLGVSIENARYTWRADVLREIPAAVRFISAEPLLGSLFETRGATNGDLGCGDGVGNVRVPDMGAPPLDEDDSPTHAARRLGEHERQRAPGACHVAAVEGSDLASAVRATPSRAPLDLTGIDWLIVGGESGGRFARPMHPDWARELRDACLTVDVPMRTAELYEPLPELRRPAFFFKQWGSWVPTQDLTSDRDDDLRLYTSLDGLGRFLRYAGARAKSGGRELDGRTWNEMPAARLAVAAA